MYFSSRQQSPRKRKAFVAQTILIALAGLMGASGIALAAIGAHATPNAGLQSAAFLLLLHAAAVLAGVAIIQQGLLWQQFGVGVMAAWILGATLFAADVALRAFAWHRLFVFAAPTGGIILITAWVGLAAAALSALVHRAGWHHPASKTHWGIILARWVAHSGRDFRARQGREIILSGKECRDPLFLPQLPMLTGFSANRDSSPDPAASLGFGFGIVDKAALRP
jgi:uncharacterized membrane protein YgdD (TMEM256/DUF423 family)